MVTAALSGSTYAAGSGTDLANYALMTGEVSANVGEIIQAVGLGYGGAVTSAQNVSSVNGSSSVVFSSIVGLHGPATSTGDSDNTIATSSPKNSVDGGIASMQTKDNLAFHRTFSIADGGIKLPSGVSESDSTGSSNDTSNDPNKRK